MKNDNNKTPGPEPITEDKVSEIEKARAIYKTYLQNKANHPENLTKIERAELISIENTK